MREILNRGGCLERRSGRIIVIASDSAKAGRSRFWPCTMPQNMRVRPGARSGHGGRGDGNHRQCGVSGSRVDKDGAGHGPQLAEIYGIPPEGMHEFLRSLDPLKRIATPRRWPMS